MDTSRCSKCGNSSAGLPTKAFDISVAPGTRHHTLLNSNEPPEDSDFAFIRSAVSSVDARLACLDDEILDLEEKLRLLEEERASLSSYRARNRAILLPLRKFPPEVLGEIFAWSLPSITEARRHKFDIADSPWIWTHVSSRWRAVSLATPSLWSRIIIDADDVYPVSLIETQIQRAQKLKIHFYGCETADSRPQIQMFQLLSQHASRWEEFSVDLTSKMIPLLFALRDQLSSLERLWVQWDEPQSQAAVASLDSFASAPSLVDVGIQNEFRFVPITLPVHQLTRLQLDAPWETHTTILKLARNLIQVHIRIDFDDEPWPQTDETINLSHLRHLYLSHPEALAYLTAPALDELGFFVEQDDPLDIPPLVTSFLDRSACPVRRLCLRGSPDAYTISQILRQFSSIIELVIGTSIAGPTTRERANTLMAALAVSSSTGSTTIAPHLSLVLLMCAQTNYMDYNTYFEMVNSRWQAADCALKSAVLLTESGSGLDPATLRRLHTLRQEGLDFLHLEGPAASMEMGAWEHYAWAL